ncbi:IS66-like element accessory protein TnpA, partial [Pseudorhizobium pelagicum]|uniref:IS66-like element accessory protein TnpA n=1 Tax=Pseudorhizobium pelagicum TaxID=1509405 RepID=UPI0009DF80C9
MARIEIISGTERRRRWSDEAKLRILAEADEPGARISDVARRHDIHPDQIRLWRQSFSHADRPTVFLPVEITEEVGVSWPTTAATRPAIVEILLRNGRRLKVPVDVELKLLGPLVACVEGGMIGPSGNVRVYLACGVTDMRRGIDGLSALVETVVKEAPSVPDELLRFSCPFRRLIHFAAGLYPTISGGFTATERTRFQSMPSTSAMSWAW